VRPVRPLLPLLLCPRFVTLLRGSTAADEPVPLLLPPLLLPPLLLWREGVGTADSEGACTCIDRISPDCMSADDAAETGEVELASASPRPCPSPAALRGRGDCGGLVAIPPGVSPDSDEGTEVSEEEGGALCGVSLASDDAAGACGGGAGAVSTRGAAEAVDDGAAAEEDGAAKRAPSPPKAAGDG
jgi:hypothetical protein